MRSITVLVVDDSVVVRRLVTDALGAVQGIEVVGVAANGRIALAKVGQLAPDVVTMDIEMPVMDGVAAVRALRATGHEMPIIMFSTITERGAAATFDALAAGATDYVTKPSGAGSLTEALARVTSDLVPRIVALVPRAGVGWLTSQPATAGTTTTPAAGRAGRAAIRLLPRPEPRPVRAVVLGSSTGGPEALSRVLQGFSARLAVPMVVVQHMPPVFTRQLAARLDRLGPSTVVEAAGGEALVPGTVYVAPGDHHLELVRAGDTVITRLSQASPVNYCRPSVDVTVRSAVATYGGDLLAVVLTGMGSDGRVGCEQVLAAGGRVVVQDEATSVVWGMPGAIATGPGAHAVLPLSEIAETIRRIAARTISGSAA